MLKSATLLDALAKRNDSILMILETREQLKFYRWEGLIMALGPFAPL